MRCGNASCLCTHTEPCLGGWIWIVQSEMKLVKLKDGSLKHETINHEAVKPCPTCFPEKAEIFAKARSREELHHLLQMQSKHNQKKIQEEESWGKTRTL